MRGIETAAGRVAAVVTEKGRIACQSVVLAGGAWSRLFCGNLGIDLPQLKVLGSVMRTERLDGGPEISASGGLFGYRKRMDGGYTVATLGVRTIDLVPDSFRLLPEYLPSIRLHWKKLRLRVGRRFAEEWQTPRRWSLDQPSPFEAVRVLDPAADPVVLDRARASIAEAFPAFRDVAVAESWGGMIDVMPDAIPVISAVDTLPGFFHRDRLFRARFRHRPGGGPAGCRYGDRRAADRRPGAVPPVALYRRVEPAAAPARQLIRRPDQFAGDLLPQLRQQPLDPPAAALDHRGELVALRHLHADAGDIDIGDLVPPAVIGEIPIDADRTAGEHDFAADHGLSTARVGAGYPERLAAETAEAGAIGARDIFLEQRKELLLFLRGGGTPVAAENETANAGHVELAAEQRAEPAQAAAPPTRPARALEWPVRRAN